MADSPITKKTHGSLSRRILIIAVLLLVIPLFLQTLFLYRQEYEQKLQDVDADLKMLAGERAHFIDETLQMDWSLLEESHNVPFIERIPLPPNARDRFVAVSKSRQALLAGIAETHTDALVIPIPFAMIARDMPRSYQVRIALIDGEKNVLWESSQAEGDDLQADDPIGETGISVRLSVEKKEIKGLHQQSYYLRFAATVFFVGIIGGGCVFLFTRRIAKPLRHLSKTMERVSEGAAHVRYTPDWMGFEINALGLQFNETLDGLLRHAGEAERERLHREKLAKELSIGHEIQSNLLPTHAPGFHGLDIASAYFAAKEVNGDFYDLFKMPDGRLLIAVCDTAGKGISACLFALGLRSILRALASTATDLAELVRMANDVYWIDAHSASMFSTLWIGIFDPRTKRLIYCSQGHPPAFLVRGAQLEELWTEGIALGAQKVDHIPTKEILMTEGDLLVLYTDGIVEAHNSENKLFGKNRFTEILMKKQKSSAQNLADRIIEEVRLFTGAAAQHDDMTLLVISVKK